MDETLKNRILAAAKTDTQNAEKKPPLRLRRVALSVVAACLVVVFGVGVAASAFPSFEQFLTRMGEDLRALVQPVGLVSVHEGIRMEVLAAVNDGGAACVYLSLTDQRENRIDENTKLYNMEISDTFFGFGRQVDFDADTGTAIFRLEGDGKVPLSGEKITVTVDSILTGYEFHESIDTGLTLADVLKTNPSPETEGANPLGEDGMAGSGFSLSYGSNAKVSEAIWETFEKGELPLLQPGGEWTIAPGWVTVTGMGVLQDLLHIRFSLPGTAIYGDGDFFLSWPDGPQRGFGGALASAKMGLGEPIYDGSHTLHESYEQFLELPENIDPSQVSILYSGHACSGYIKGGWEVSFELDESPPTLEADCSIDLNGLIIDKIVLSSIGVTAYGRGDFAENSLPFFIEVQLEDGSVAEFGSSSVFYGEGDNITLRDNLLRPIDIEKVSALLVNGESILVS